MSPYSKRSNIRSKLDLKTCRYRSHNLASDDEKIKELVRFLARCAAAEDYRMHQDALASLKKNKRW